ncbi:MAG: tRNA (5-methylaminomethyl-2-thiouridine)(34)-methyltransferase MnmD [Prolixibacteraceae bacterium]|nr:tRNA (5-methylaminomethyl-2-thiouridine)(34)-methyltransferase MnmD [Prolixibacteraceae bacterium]MBN2773406.1 tRNA (5-methylaminomethyl-2-thiouridine)(34)-methyltransferase MnmD [Prolixibacteraceae bacterium]
MANPEITITADGSHTLFVAELNEPYHSVNGAVTESMHVFIENALLFRNKKDIVVFEVGFGTGLNCLLTALKAMENGLKIKYITIEKYPLDPEIIKKLNYPSFFKDDRSEIWEKIHESPWDRDVELNNNFKLYKINADILLTSFSKISQNFDVVYFDAFAPDVQPALWQPEIFSRLFEKCNKKAVLTTYSAKGSVRRTMISAGFKVEKLPGPPGKKEMLRGIIPD